jgi:hypothetical protein
LLSTIINKFNNRIFNKAGNKDNNNKNKKNSSNVNIAKNTKIWKNIKKAQKLYRYRIPKILLPFLLISSTLLVSFNQIGEQHVAFAYHQQYNLPLPSELEHQPSYAIRIPFGAGQTDFL